MSLIDSASTPTPGLNFLVVEDDDFQRGILMKMLAQLHLGPVYSAADGRTALDVIAQLNEPIDILITDLDMPGMDGMELIRHIGAAEKKVSVIIASALDRSLLSAVETMTRAYGINLLGALPKPVTVETVRALVNAHCAYRSNNTARAEVAGRSYALSEVLAGIKEDQFEPFFQPKVLLSNNRVIGAEALARWRHPQHGIVAPSAFIELLESNGAIDGLMWVMLEKTAAFGAMLRKNDVESTLSVNICLTSLSDVDLADRITELVRRHGLEPKHFVLEMTESAATSHLGNALENLTRLRMKGFGLSIDDYGTGYSSMQQLTCIPFTELKIDRSFVTNAAQYPAARIILESSLQMARKLGIVAVAEGVETRSDWNLLCELDCDYAQGYFIAKPMERALYLAWVQHWHEMQ
jgi:EAL domain-containing protein (putative c-di-GMP-specific phosphodiesterase class I)